MNIVSETPLVGLTPIEYTAGEHYEIAVICNIVWQTVIQRVGDWLRDNEQ